MLLLSHNANRFSPKGYMTLVSIIIVSTLAVATGVSMTLLGIDAARMSTTYTTLAQARSLSESCAEAALHEVSLDPSYTTGEQTIDFAEIPNSWCSYTVEAATEENGEEQRIIKSSGAVLNAIARHLLIVTVGPTEVSPTPALVSWGRVATF